MKKNWYLALAFLFSVLLFDSNVQAAAVLLEEEPNGTQLEAMSIQFGQTYEGRSGYGDGDYFKFTLDQPGKVNIALKNDPKESWYFSLEDSKKQQYIGGVKTTYGTTVSDGIEKETVRSLGLSAGTYYLYIFGGKYMEDKPYQFTVTQEDGAFYEIEPNNSEVNANDILFNHVYKGYSNKDDADYFKFTLDQETPITLSIKNHPLLNWQYRLLNSKGEKIIDFTKTKTGTVVADKIETHTLRTITLPKGSYYAYIYGGSGHGNQPYELAVYKGASFKDVPLSHWGNLSVEWAKEKGIVSGYKDGTFKPNETLTEAQAVGIFTRFYDIKPTTGSTSKHWAAGQYETLNKQGYKLKGYANEKEKNKPITRGALAQLIYYGQGGTGSVEEAVQYMIKQDLTTAKTVQAYNPNGSLTRVHAAAFFHRIEEKGYTGLKR